MALGWEDSLHGAGPQLRDEGEGCGGVEAADHQPLGHRGQRLVSCEAQQAHATQEADQSLVVEEIEGAHIKNIRDLG